MPDCPKSYSEVNEENTPCLECGSRQHFIGIGDKDFSIRCSWCGSKIDDINPELIPLITKNKESE
jgi:hypothetical protein